MDGYSKYGSLFCLREIRNNIPAVEPAGTFEKTDTIVHKRFLYISLNNCAFEKNKIVIVIQMTWKIMV